MARAMARAMAQAMAILQNSITSAELTIMANHQIFSGQLWHLTGQTKFDQTNLLYIINGEVNECIKENECPDNF